MTPAIKCEECGRYVTKLADGAPICEVCAMSGEARRALGIILISQEPIESGPKFLTKPIDYLHFSLKMALGVLNGVTPEAAKEFKDSGREQLLVPESLAYFLLMKMSEMLPDYFRLTDSGEPDEAIIIVKPLPKETALLTAEKIGVIERAK